MNRRVSMTALMGIYLAVAMAAIAAGYVIPIHHPLPKAAVVDAIATLLIFGFSIRFDNSSVYDPYWSIAPIFITGFWLISAWQQTALSVRGVLIVVLILIWSNRLTYNFFRQWNGFHHEDWRYVRFRKKTGKLYWPISLLGIHFFPSAIVFLACIPTYYAIYATDRSLSFWGIAAVVVALGATAVETFADNQLRRYILTRTRTDQTMRTGLWKYSRHPNYFGEIAFWWAMYLFVLDTDATFWWTIVGPIIVTLLFLFVSIPLIEEKLIKSKSDYKAYQGQTPALLPWLPKG